MIVPDTYIDTDIYPSYDGYVTLDFNWTDFSFNCTLSPKQTKEVVVKLQTILAQLETNRDE